MRERAESPTRGANRSESMHAVAALERPMVERHSGHVYLTLWTLVEKSRLGVCLNFHFSPQTYDPSCILMAV